MAGQILMLEDDPTRIARFSAVLSQITSLSLIHWRDAHLMIRECAQYLPTCRLIALDHDLEPEFAGVDPGDGLDVARFLAPLGLTCPVLIHSSNGDRVRRMVGEFELNGLSPVTVLPLGADWVEHYWRDKVLAALNDL